VQERRAIVGASIGGLAIFSDPPRHLVPPALPSLLDQRKLQPYVLVLLAVPFGVSTYERRPRSAVSLRLMAQPIIEVDDRRRCEKRRHHPAGASEHDAEISDPEMERK